MSCPICNRDSVTKYRPFCSKRCADIDLGKWFDGSYSIPARDDDPEANVLDEGENAARPDVKPH